MEYIYYYRNIYNVFFKRHLASQDIFVGALSVTYLHGWSAFVHFQVDASVLNCVGGPTIGPIRGVFVQTLVAGAPLEFIVQRHFLASRPVIGVVSPVWLFLYIVNSCNKIILELTMRLKVQAAEGVKAVNLNWCHPNGAAALCVGLPVDLGSSKIRKYCSCLHSWCALTTDFPSKYNFPQDSNQKPYFLGSSNGARTFITTWIFLRSI